jgi:hypothetical protein
MRPSNRTLLIITNALFVKAVKSLVFINYYLHYKLIKNKDPPVMLAGQQFLLL